MRSRLSRISIFSFSLRFVLEEVVDRCAVWRIRESGVAAGPGAAATTPANGIWSGQQRDRARGDRLVGFANRLQIVEDPDRAPVRADDQIVPLDHQIVHRHGRQIELEPLPGSAVVDRIHHAALGAEVQLPAPGRILTNGVEVDVLRNCGIEPGPGLAEVGGLVQVRPVVVESMRVDDDVRGGGVERRGFDQADRGPLRHARHGRASRSTSSCRRLASRARARRRCRPRSRPPASATRRWRTPCRTSRRRCCRR